MKPIQIVFNPLFDLHSAGTPQYHISNMIDFPYNLKPHIWRPNTDFFETDENFYVRVEVSGMNESEFSLVIDQNHLLINGIRSDNGERKIFHQMEIHYGEFNVIIDIPASIIIDKVEATYMDGILSVVLPKTKPKHVFVK